SSRGYASTSVGHLGYLAHVVQGPERLCSDAMLGRIVMQARVGDRLHVHGRHVGNPDKVGKIIEVRGAGGTPPYVVRFDNGQEALVFPGPDAVVEPAESRAEGERAVRGRQEAPPSAW
ncbi:MAG TPA: DUF1918 domain-containing protein, partial [Actinopolymorphaceae bacterium]